MKRSLVPKNLVFDVIKVCERALQYKKAKKGGTRGRGLEREAIYGNEKTPALFRLPTTLNTNLWMYELDKIKSTATYSSDVSL